MNKTFLKAGLLVLFLVLSLVLVKGAIVGSGNSNINILVLSGSFVAANCTSGNAITGFGGGGVPICNPFVFSVTQGVGLLFNPNPITQSGVISLANATELTVGGVNVRNCSSGFHVSGWFGNMTPFCSGDAFNGSVSSISQGEGIVNNPNPITDTGTVMLANATNMTLGGIRLANCTGTARFSGFNASLNPICTAVSGSGGVQQITIYEGLSSNETPITSNATLVLNNATELAIGGTRVRNCSSGFHITGYFGNMTPICTGELNNGTVTSIDNAEGISVNPDPITGTGIVLLNNATNMTLGGIRLANCTGTDRFSGFNGSLNPICTPTASGSAVEITLYEGLSSNQTPITSNATLVLNNASQLLNGGVKIFNCSSGFHVSGWFGNMTPFCSGDAANGTVTSLTQNEGITLNPNPITGVGNVLLSNATTSTIGGVRVLNCTGNGHISGYDSSLNPFCSANNGNGTLTSLTGENGITLNPSTITSTGVIMATNATPASLGVIRTVNCTIAGTYFDSFATNNTPTCTAEVGDISSVQAGTGLQGGNVSGGAVLYLQNASAAQIGGVLASNCTGTDKFSGVTGGGVLSCSADSGGSGTLKQITIYEGLSSNETPITSNATLLLNNATELAIGGTRVRNCTSGFHITGYFGNMTPICTGELNNGTVTSIDNAEGISVNPDPITGTGIVLLNNATTSTIGGTRVLNCTGNGHVSGWDGSMNPFCSANNGNGTVTSIASGSGITLNPDPITSTGVVMATNATLSVLGVTKLTNCSTGFYLNGWNATNIPNCVGQLNNGTVTSISEGEGIMANPNPIVSIGNILLRNATELLLGGVKVRNCSSTQGITGWLGNLTGICGDLGGAGLGIKQLTFGVGVSGNESPLLNNGTIFLKNASSTELGGVTASNCSVLESFTGITGGGAHVCTTNGLGRGIRQLTWIGNVFNVNETPTYTNASVMLNNASIVDAGLVRVSNCTAGQFVQGWNGGTTPICGIPSSGNMNISTQLLYSNHTNFNLTASGDCYRYTLPANQFDQIYVQAWADMFSTAITPASWNATINFSNTEVQNTQVRAAAIAASYSIIPVSLSYNQTSSASLNITMRGVEIEDSGSFICKGMSVWGVNNASFVSRDHGNPYCNPQLGEFCSFFNFGGGDATVVSAFTSSAPSQIFDGGVGNTCVTSAGFRRDLAGFGVSSCLQGFYSLGLGQTAGFEGSIILKSNGIQMGTVQCNAATDSRDNCTKVINSSEIFEFSTRLSNHNLTSNGGMNRGGMDNVSIFIGFITRNDTASNLQSNFTPNGLQNMIAFYHYRNDTNWSAITMFGGNASNQTTVLPLDFNSTATLINFNSFKIVRENSTGNMLFYLNSSLVANHSSFIPDWTNMNGIFMMRHNNTVAAELKYLVIDWIKYYHNNTKGFNGNFVEVYP